MVLGARADGVDAALERVLGDADVTEAAAAAARIVDGLDIADALSSHDAELAAALEPLAAMVLDAGVVPFPNAMGLSRAPVSDERGARHLGTAPRDPPP